MKSHSALTFSTSTDPTPLTNIAVIQLFAYLVWTRTLSCFNQQLERIAVRERAQFRGLIAGRELLQPQGAHSVHTRNPNLFTCYRLVPTSGFLAPSLNFSHDVSTFQHVHI